MVGGIGPSSTTVGDRVGTLGAGDFAVAIFVVVLAKLLVVYHFPRLVFGTLTPLPIWPNGLKGKRAVARRKSNPRFTKTQRSASDQK